MRPTAAKLLLLSLEYTGDWYPCGHKEYFKPIVLLRVSLQLFLVLASLFLIPLESSAQLSPGKLSQVHAEIDSNRDCFQCHTQGKGVTAELCLSCHGFLAARIRADAGLHAQPEYRACETCHIDHHGREFELIWWGKEGIKAFNHETAGYPLLGAHRREDCRSCHRATNLVHQESLRKVGKDLNRTFLGLGTDCATCHEDPHGGQFLAKTCAQCHGEVAWKPATGFDHDRTQFALDGGHTQVGCAECHSPTSGKGAESWIRYRGTPTACADCHRDPHRGRLDGDCVACHTTADWRKVDQGRFNHDLTRYPLRGRHRSLGCASCHQETSFRVADFNACSSCHADEHAGQFLDREEGSACAQCHDVRGFSPSDFSLEDHAKTRFPLEIAHRQVPCLSCHPKVSTADLVAQGVARLTPEAPRITQVFHLETEGCADCHEDPHGGTADAYLGEQGCRSCHQGDDWRTVSFDHSATNFPLEGVHPTVTCVACHAGSESNTDTVTLSLGGAPTVCRGCHEDPHRGQFDSSGILTSCGDCHRSEGWVPTLFDHSRDSSFPLEGQHARAACGACHPREISEDGEMVRYRPLPIACSACHLQELGPIPPETMGERREEVLP